MDFSGVVPGLINLGPTGVVVAIFLWLYGQKQKEVEARDAAIEARDQRIQALHEARYADQRAYAEARSNDIREMQRVTMESTAATARVTTALETVAGTLSEIEAAARIEREIAKREQERGRGS